MFAHLPLLLGFLFAQGALAVHNVTVDDLDPSIIYNPRASWVVSAPTTLNAGGAHMLTLDGTATATFVFTGNAIYFMSPLWPYLVNTVISLDSGPAVLVDLVDHSRPDQGEGSETVQSSVVWSATGLANVQHTLIMSVGAGQPYAVVDTLIYTALDPGDAGFISSSSQSSTPLTSATSSSASSSRTLATPAETTSTSSSAKSSPTTGIAIGAALGAVGLIVIFGLLWFFCRRRKSDDDDIQSGWTGDGQTTRPISQVSSAGPLRNPASHNLVAGPPYAAPSHHYDPRAYPLSNAANNGQSFSPYDQSHAAYMAVPAGAAAMHQPHPHERYHQPNYYQHDGGYNPYPDATPISHPMANRAMNRPQSNTLSTITEGSQPSYTRGSAGGYTPASAHAELGYRSGHGQTEGSDVMSSVGSGSRPNSSYQPYYSGHAEKSSSANQSKDYAYPTGGTPSQTLPVQPPAYTPDA